MTTSLVAMGVVLVLEALVVLGVGLMAAERISARELRPLPGQCAPVRRAGRITQARLLARSREGDAGPGSDLDLLVDLEAGRSLLDHAALVIELESLLGCKVDIATEQGLRPRVRERVLSEAVAL